ncbi:MAG: cytochrome c [Gammaproteobacteria bacterium]|nr:cytochrome c [Gammaproteobacteria bacterium]MCW8909405.1 cytochrome c [Gammaproteobacteria bacterium]MCW9004231.1 cytochrome c [Gammaproteobacteria bacterium]MCW9055200.1 cytochrome c [Gammaproteobacteria bacterium]
MLKTKLFIQLLVILLLAHSTAKAEESDSRVLVSIPEESLQLMRKDMIGLISALAEIMQSLSTGDFKIAAEIAETRMGRSAMGKHRSTGMGPGRFMPIPMRNIAWGLHDSASEFAEIAIKGDAKQTYTALNKVISHCAACHNTYRTK